MRAAVILLVVAILVEPVFSVETERGIDRYVVVCVDDSESMHFADETDYRIFSDTEISAISNRTFKGEEIDIVTIVKSLIAIYTRSNIDDAKIKNANNAQGS